MDDKTWAIYPHKLNIGFSLIFPDGYFQRQTPEQGWLTKAESLNMYTSLFTITLLSLIWSYLVPLSFCTNNSTLFHHILRTFECSKIIQATIFVRENNQAVILHHCVCKIEKKIHCYKYYKKETKTNI